ncbi:MAG: hypothetical protein CMI52_04050 [Parcubacteria group bacterium]|nr:hypothetical protein [Parcubacteria group bacterium]
MENKQFSKITDILGGAAFSGFEAATKNRESEKSRNPENEKTRNQEPTANDQKMVVVREALRDISSKLLNVAKLLDDDSSAAPTNFNTKPSINLEDAEPIDGTIIEGVFDGQNMIGADGKKYTVPPNYASKSKLVEGDMMKLTITKLGAYVFKQIGPTERARLQGIIVFDQDNKQYGVHCDGKTFNVLKASVTFYKGNIGDSAVILVPQDSPSQWGAIENII